jgi:Trypsin-like peptidase domain
MSNVRRQGTSIALPSVQSLLIEMFFGAQPLSTGTGFVCNSAKGPVLVTNWHNLAGRNPLTKQPLSPTAAIPDQINIVHNQAGQLGAWHVKSEPLFANGSPRWIEHPTLGDKADFVALPLTNLGGVQLYPYDLLGGPAIVVGPAESISVVGFPFGLQAGGSLAVWATGFIASEPQIDFNGLPVFLIDCRSRPGQSGSAVIIHRNAGTFSMQDVSTAMMTGQVTKFQGAFIAAE